MSRKRIRKLLSAAMGVLALGGSVSSAHGENDTISMSDDNNDETRPQNDMGADEDFEGGYPEDLDADPAAGDEMAPAPAAGEDWEPAPAAGFEDYDARAVDELRERMSTAREKVSGINSKFMELSSKWTSTLSKSGGASLKDNNTTINQSIKNANRFREEFDRANNDFTREIAANPSSERIYDILDKAENLARQFEIAVNQLSDNMLAYERDLSDVNANDRVVDQQKRKVNANLLVNNRNSVSEYLKDVRLFMKNTKFTDIKGYKGQVDKLSVKLSDIRKKLESKGDDGVSNDEFNSISTELRDVRNLLQSIRSSVADAGQVYNKETNHGMLTRTLLQINAMWRGFSSECNPKKVLASGMSADSVEQCNVFYNTVKSNYAKLRKAIRGRIQEALKDMDGYSEDVERFCQNSLAEFNASIVASTRSFTSVQEFEAARQKQVSPAEYRQKARVDFVNECRSIRDRDELTPAERIDELVGAMNKILPGRESFHRQMLNLLSRDVQIDAAGNVDATSLLSKNTLLIGAPGNGKTEEARAAADALGLKIIYANGDDFATETASNRFYNNLVNETLNANGRYAIFFDEIDSIFSNRALTRDVAGEATGAVTVFNNFVTRMQSSPELMRKYAGMMGTTNLAPDALDPALTSRFPQQLHVPRFDESDARQFLRVELEPISITANTTKEALIGTLATIMANRNMDARKALNLIDEVWSYAKSNMDSTPTIDAATAGGGDSFEDDASADVIIEPRDLVSAFNGMKLGGDKKKNIQRSGWDRNSNELKDDRVGRWDRDNINDAPTRPSTPLKY